MSVMGEAPYRDELDMGETKGNAQVAGFLFNAARNGNVTAQIFWLKTRARWKETPTELRHSGSIARRDVSELTDQELMDRIFELQAQAGVAPGPARALMRSRPPDLRDISAEIVRCVNAAQGVGGYVIRLSEPPTLPKRLQLMAARQERRPIVIMPHKCKTVAEWQGL